MVSVNLADEVASTAATASPASSETSLVGTWRGEEEERKEEEERERERKKRSRGEQQEEKKTSGGGGSFVGFSLLSLRFRLVGDRFL